jgi:hypothetical protein
MTTIERRRHRRYGFTLRASVRAGGSPEPVPGTLMDMSAGGAFFTAPVEAAEGASGYVRFQRGRELCEATGRVVRVLPFGSMQGVGVEFAFANDGLIYFLRELSAAAEVVRGDLLTQIEELALQIE